MSDSTDHYVAHIKIERVVRASITGSTRNPETKREVTETLNVTVKSRTLDGLKGKIAAHSSLIDEEDL